MTADCRLDLPASFADYGVDRGSTDIELLASAWWKEGESVLPRIVGDAALAVWDERDQSLVLARSPLSDRALAWTRVGGAVLFSGNPGQLAALQVDGANPNIEGLAAWIAGSSANDPTRTSFRDVEIVPPGTAIRFTPTGERRWRFWSAKDVGIAGWTDAEAAQRLRRALEEAVCARIGSGDKVAAHLSAGRDSSAVAALAARIMGMEERPLLAITAAPHVSEPATCGDYLIDESGPAAELAGRFANVEHVILRTERVALGHHIDRAHRSMAFPFGGLINFHWWSRSLAVAEAAGCSVLLTGQSGNSGLSAGGPGALPDLFNNSPLGWAVLARSIAGNSPAAARNVASLTFGARLPRGLFRIAHRAFGTPRPVFDNHFLGGPLKTAVQREFDSQLNDPRPPANYRLELQKRLDTLDWANGRSASSPVDVRDPTADRRVIETALSLTSAQLASEAHRRPVYDRAFEDLLGPPVPRLRGSQSVDWYRAYDPTELHDLLDTYASNGCVRELIDTDAIACDLRSWPAGVAGRDRRVRLRASAMLSAFATASFLAQHFN